MTLNEMKVEALRIMAVNLSEDIRAEDMESLLVNENYASFLVNMEGAVNRCLSAIERRRVLPLRSEVLTGVLQNGRLRVDLSALPDYYDVASVLFEDESGYDRDVAFFREGEVAVIPNPMVGTYRALYYPTVTRVTQSGGAEDIGVPDRIACLIPLFIVGEVFMSEEPEIAASARTRFEAAMAELMQEDRTEQDCVIPVYEVDL